MILFWLGIAGKLLLRGWRSTLALGTMIFAAVALLVFLAALAEGTNDAMVRNSVGLFSGHVSGTSLPPSVTPATLRVDGVAGVCLRDVVSVQLQGDGASLPLTLLAVDPACEHQQTSLWRKLERGHYLQGDDAILLSTDLAATLAADIGQPLTLVTAAGYRTVHVGGLYRTGLAALDQGIAFVTQGLLPGLPAARSAAVFCTPGADTAAVRDRLAAAVPAARWQAWADFMPDLRQLIDLNYVSMTIVLLLVFVVVGLGISCAFVIFILRTLREYGILKTMGLRPTELSGLILAQIILLTLVTAAAGAACGALAVALMGHSGIDLTAWTSQNRYFAVSGIIYPRLTTYALGAPPLLALLAGIAAAVWPVAFVLRSRPAAILRSL